MPRRIGRVLRRDDVDRASGEMDDVRMLQVGTERKKM
jgi:hypothetical protein